MPRDQGLQGHQKSGAASLVTQEATPPDKPHLQAPGHQDCRGSTQPSLTQMPSRPCSSLPRCDELCQAGCWASSNSWVLLPQPALSLSCLLTACHPGPCSPRSWSCPFHPCLDSGTWACPGSPNASDLHCHLSAALSAAGLGLCSPAGQRWLSPPPIPQTPDGTPDTTRAA